MSGGRHPKASGKPGLVMDSTEHMPIVGKVKLFHTFNECTVCTVETRDTDGQKRGAVAVGFSKHDRADGVATYSTIEEAEAFVALMRNAIDDARRIENGQAPLAREGIDPPVMQ